jgi:hypothetical protein
LPFPSTTVIGPRIWNVNAGVATTVRDPVKEGGDSTTFLSGHSYGPLRIQRE